MRFLEFQGLLFILFFFYLPQLSLASVLAIDYGSDFIKASLMKPGVPFDVLLNKDSKRKISAVVAFKKRERLFGQDAYNLASRYPADTFSSLKLLEGAPFESQPVRYFKRMSPLDLVETSRGTVGVVQSDGTQWSVEELVAMEFAYIKQLAESVAGEKVTDVIVTVPPYFSQFERDAIVDSIEIAGLKTLALINDGTAVAVNYALTRTFSKPEYHIVYDAGASGIRATVVSFSTADDPKSGVAETHITVSGVGYDRLTSGTELDRRMRDILIETFNAKHKKDIRGDKRGMAKLWKEAQRVKAILSVNMEIVSQVESLAWDIDFRTKVTRAEFETRCEDLKDNFAKPILDALQNAGLTRNDITSVILAGGTTRVPMIQAAVKAIVGEDKVAVNVNADEAAVLGAALHGASLSSLFRTKPMKITDITAHDIQASYFAAASSPNARPRTINTVVFPAGSKTGTKKVMTFKRKEDFIIFLDYKHASVPGFPTLMMEVELTNVTEALANLTERGAIDPVVKATLMLSESGFVSVTDAVAFGDIKDDSLSAKLKGLFGGASSPEEGLAQDSENVPPRQEADASSTVSAAASSGTPESGKKDKKNKKDKAMTPIENTISLGINVAFTTIAPMTVEEKRAARSRLRSIDVEEAAKTRREEARNTFEGYLYRLRDLLNDDNEEAPFKKCSQESERRAIAGKLEDSFAWLHDRGELAETSQFLDKRIALETLEKPIIHRYQEIEAFPQALNNSQMWNWSTRLFLTEARENLTAEASAGLPSKWIREELDALEKTLRDHERWLSEWVEKQKDVKSNEDPLIETTEMKARAKVLEQHLQRLWRRKVPKVKPKKTSTRETENATATKSVSDEKETTAAEDGRQPVREPPVEGDSEQVPLTGRIPDDL